MHILIIHFLNSTVEDFFLRQPTEDFFLYQPTEKVENLSVFGCGPWPCLNPACKYYQQNNITAYEISRFGKFKTLAAIFRCSCGFAYICSPHSLDDRIKPDRVISYGSIWKTKLQELWLDPTVSLESIVRQLGASRDILKGQAAKLQLPVPRISSYLLRMETLQMSHTKVDRLAYREQWLALIREFPDAGVTSLLKLNTKIGNWLYHNDKEWFLEHKPARKSIKRPYVDKLLLLAKQTPSTEEDTNNDIAVANAIKNAFEFLICQEPPKKITLKSISMRVPQVNTLRLKIDKAPLTIKAIKEAVETSEVFAIRRIKWAAQRYREVGFCPTRGAFVKKLRLYPYTHLPVVQKTIDEAMIAMSQPGAHAT